MRKLRPGAADLPEEVGANTEQVGFDELCTRWNREEAENVARSKRTLQSSDTTREAKFRAIDELEYWAIRRGGYDAEIILIGLLNQPDRELAAHAHICLKKTWRSHFNAWVNNKISQALMFQKEGKVDQTMEIINKTIFENPLWGEGYHLRAKVWNQMKNVDATIYDLEKALEYCPNNYVTMVELAIQVMDKKQDYERAEKLLREADDLCPLLPISAFQSMVYEKAPHLKALAEEQKAAKVFSEEAPPGRLMPEYWIDRKEAIERPNQAFLRVGGELEQWFSQMRDHGLSKGRQRKLWSILVISWDPDKHTRELRSFTTQVHEALKSRRERELAKAVEEQSPFDQNAELEIFEDEDPRSFLRRLRAERKKKREAAATAAR